ncbi:MAG: transglycosylase domain-containing protein [Rubrobacteraceae bacterium]
MNNFFETSKKYKKGKKRRMGPFVWMLRTAFNLALVMAVVLAAGTAMVYVYLTQEYGDLLDRQYPDLVQNSRVYDANGDEIATFRAVEERETVGPEGLGKNLPDAVVAIEDRRFEEHFGVDFEGVGRAAWTDLRSWQVREGGSTITEQLVKNLYVDQEQRLEISFWRRLKQSTLAFAYERGHTKKEILTAYLNTVYFGDGAYGAELAAKRYFGKSAEELTLSEAAALAGFLHAPSTYLPDDPEGLDRIEERRDRVLAIMREEGMISAAEFEEAKGASLVFAPDPPPENPLFEPFIEKVSREVEEQLGPEALRKGGLEIQTTLEPGLQEAAAESAGGVLGYPDDPSGAVATVEPQTGAIKVLYGQKEDFNLALDARRQPGSSFKPMVLAAALKQDISPDTVYVSKDLEVGFQGVEYPVTNYEYVERGPITVGDAMVESDNTVFVQFALDLGLRNVAETAKDLGVTTPVEPYPSTAIGGLGTGVSVLDMASAYATFAGAGVYREPYSVETIERRYFGERDQAYDHGNSGRRIMSGNQAAAVNDVLRRVVEDEDATGGRDLDEELGRPSAGKTGTTDDFADAWYVGYTPRLSTAVWVGYPDERRSMVDIRGLDEVNGASLPLDLWSSYMQQATEGKSPLDFSDADYSDFGTLNAGYAANPPATSYVTAPGNP